MLLNNYAQVNRNTGRGLGPAFSNPFGMFKATLFPSFCAGDHVVAGETDRSAFPNGYSGVYAWWPAPKPGGIGSINSIAGSGDVVGSVAGGVNGEAALSGSGDLTGIGQLIVSLAAALSGSGGVSNADLVAYLQLAATLAGSGDLAGLASALASAAAVLEGEGGASATATATGALAAAITVVGAGLTTGNVGQAVWSALAVANNDAGTMGAKLNAAASGGVDLNALADAVWDHSDAVAVATKLALLEKIARNKSITDPATGEFVLYDDDGTTELFRVPLWEDAAGTQAYRGQGAERKERLA